MLYTITATVDKVKIRPTHKEAALSFCARAHALKFQQIYDFLGILPRFSHNSWELSFSFLQRCYSTSIHFPYFGRHFILKTSHHSSFFASLPKNGGVCPIKSSIFEFHPHPSLGFYTILHINSHKTFTTISTNHWHNTLVIKIYLVFFVAKSA